MNYSWIQIVWLFFLYSLVGWAAEVCTAAFQKRKFINRGFVNGPLCPIYGFAAALFCLFLPELTGNLFFLFLGGVVLSTVLEYVTGLLLEKTFHKKLWDYSSHKWNLDGYICAKYSLLWGILCVVTMLFLNPLLCAAINLIPRVISLITLWGLAVLLFLDFLSTALTVLGMQKEAARFAQLTEGMQQTSRIMEHVLTQKVAMRMMKSFPSIDMAVLTQHKTQKLQNTGAKATHFAQGLCFYKLTALFFIGAFLGDITETIFCLLTTGTLMSRSSVVYGPFSIVWGLGCAIATALLYRYRDKSDRYIFLAGMILGGAYEYICSVFTELAFGTVFWDYSGFAFNLGGRINLLYCLFWGIAAVVWLKIIYPKLSGLIERIPRRLGTILSNCLIVFMIFNVILSGLALARYQERNMPLQAEAEVSAFDTFLDTHFDNERMKRIYPNAKIVVDGVPKRIDELP